ncbi:hypothetical protein DCS_03241 [Drechmeria coniospora]|uniref:Uncharacterized protein n=1 Tax=Drechmeria coniospora TaxID=98403 RepID=A0A151GYC6_DRECN|nr:hypothetical protein DCS_03241 [Drechmeria coniospora]KYK62096.1 hypothetical protein DCS_03241 [Drechmeria coniospora]
MFTGRASGGWGSAPANRDPWRTAGLRGGGAAGCGLAPAVQRRPGPATFHRGKLWVSPSAPRSDRRPPVCARTKRTGCKGRRRRIANGQGAKGDGDGSPTDRMRRATATDRQRPRPWIANGHGHGSPTATAMDRQRPRPGIANGQGSPTVTAGKQSARGRGSGRRVESETTHQQTRVLLAAPFDARNAPPGAVLFLGRSSTVFRQKRSVCSRLGSGVDRTATARRPTRTSHTPRRGGDG